MVDPTRRRAVVFTLEEAQDCMSYVTTADVRVYAIDERSGFGKRIHSLLEASEFYASCNNQRKLGEELFNILMGRDKNIPIVKERL